jgi:hypothetical protein
MPGDRVFLLFDADEPAVSVRYLTVEAQFKPRWQIFWISERANHRARVVGLAPVCCSLSSAQRDLPMGDSLNSHFQALSSV